MQKHDKPLFDRVDVPAALGLLTRLPVRVDSNRAMARGAASAWAYPLVGLVIGSVVALLAAIVGKAGLPAQVTAGVVLLAVVVMTGAMHEDGLADCADGFWGGWEKQRRLEIMKDSRIGVYGVCAIALTLLLRWQLLVLLIEADVLCSALVAAAAASRTSMVVLMAFMPNARATGLSHSVGRPAKQAVAVAIVIGAAAAMVSGFAGVIVWVGAATALCGLIAQRKIGGQTGDVLGATQQMTEITALCAIAATLA